jgi:hypothetical protein
VSISRAQGGFRVRDLSGWLVASALSAALIGCPSGASTNHSPEPCKQMGQQCQFAPGKLGACAYKANCEGPGCLYCQSQH